MYGKFKNDYLEFKSKLAESQTNGHYIPCRGQITEVLMEDLFSLAYMKKKPLLVLSYLHIFFSIVVPTHIF